MLVGHEKNCEVSEVGTEYPGYVGCFSKVLVGKPQGWDDYTMKLYEIKPGGHTDCHSHVYLHIMFVISGKGNVHYEGKDHHLEAGNFVFFTPDVEHQISNIGDESFKYIFVTTNFDTFVTKHSK